MSITRFVAFAVVVSISVLAFGEDNVPPAGFVALFNGRDLAGWRGLPLRTNPKDPAKFVGLSMPERLSLPAAELQAAQKLGDEQAHAHWRAENGVLAYDGKGQNLITDRDYGDFELLLDWKIEKEGDSGIYLRGSPQVQIWDPDVSTKYHPERTGSGGLFNNKNNPNRASKIADRPIDQWNTFRIRMVGEKVTIQLNDETVVDGVTLENYWDKDRKTPIYAHGTIELQNHGNVLFFKNIYLKELK